MRGTSALSGKALSGLDHLRQSVRDILLTPLGSRVMRRTYGSRLLELVDAPMNRKTLLDIYSSTVDALNKWEPRFKVDQVQASKVEPGVVELTIQGTYLGQQVEIVVGRPPAITSALTVVSNLDDALSYQITATNGPTSFYVVGGLPAGLTLNTSTGLITGTVNFTGAAAIRIGARNAAGDGEATLWLSSPPVAPALITGVRLRFTNVPPVTSGAPEGYQGLLEGWTVDVPLAPANSGAWRSGTVSVGEGTPEEPAKSVSVIFGYSALIHQYEGAPWTEWIYPYSTDGYGMDLTLSVAAYPAGSAGLVMVAGRGNPSFLTVYPGDIPIDASTRGDVAGWGTSSEFPKCDVEILRWLTD